MLLGVIFFFPSYTELIKTRAVTAWEIRAKGVFIPSRCKRIKTAGQAEFFFFSILMQFERHCLYGVVTKGLHH